MVVPTYLSIASHYDQDFPKDLYAAGLVILTIVHAVTSSLNEYQRPSAKYIKPLYLSKLIYLCYTMPLSCVAI
ncbi:hypothetical protein J3R83DRAFT_7497 [Lanmaoa asiatica]|nr:hypothetical protein J3R83DRAFT_7497 [Lanmaoa asiatica]